MANSSQWSMKSTLLIPLATTQIRISPLVFCLLCDTASMPTSCSRHTSSPTLEVCVPTCTCENTVIHSCPYPIGSVGLVSFCLLSFCYNQCVSFHLLNKSSMYGYLSVPRENFEVSKVSKPLQPPHAGLLDLPIGRSSRYIGLQVAYQEDQNLKEDSSPSICTIGRL